MPRFFNPEGVPGPFNTYSHGAVVEGPVRFLFGAGQVGAHADGTVGDGIEEQARLVWQHIVTVLAEADMGISNLVQINMLLIDREHRGPASAVRSEFLGDHRPASTLMVISGLANPEWLIEIDFIAAKEIVLDGER
jgi:2-iminobutanoate/2-iminopropanoate deaminase